MIPLSGCPAANLFSGRLVLINSTLAPMRSPVVMNSHPGLNQTIPFPDLESGQAGVRDCGGDNPIVALGDLVIFYVDGSGTTKKRSVPFLGEIPDHCHQDFYIEIDHNDRVHWGLLAYKNYRQDYYAGIRTHGVAAACGLLLGWMIWGKRRARTTPGQARKSDTFET